jgi:predicted Zn-dependent protease with MMP-like domain/Tfp pilus assembly protein PilF
LADDAELAALEAELERGWQLIESGASGSLKAARSLAEDLQRRYPDAPEVLVLLGMLDSLEGDVEQALHRYEEASEIDPDYFEPLLCAAELYIWELGEDEKGLLLCQRAQDVAEEEEEYLDALLLQAEAEIGLEREEAAMETLRNLPDIDLPEPRYHVRIGRLFLDLEQVAEATKHFQRAVDQAPENGDAMHGLGLCAEHRAQRDQMIGFFRRVREVDLREPRPPWGLSEERFQKVCAAALDSLPEELRKRMANVPVLATDYPSEQLVLEGNDPRMLGLFAGVPFGEHSSVGGPPHLTAIFLFQRNIERLAYSSEDVEHEVHVTLVHEAGHFFGLSEEQLEAMGLG